VAGSKGQLHEPPAPSEIPHKGFAVLHVPFAEYDLVFSSPEQLDHFIRVLATTPLPTSRQLSARRSPTSGPNGHWLSRLPARLKAPRARAKLVQAMEAVRAQAVGAAPDAAATPRFLLPAGARR
jgi:hypothetical protein